MRFDARQRALKTGDNHQEPSPSPPDEPPPEALPVDDEPANDDAADEDPAVTARSPTA